MPRTRPMLRWLAPLVGIVLLAPPLALSLRRARADRLFTAARSPEALARACEIDPRRADCAAAVARALEQRALDAAGEWTRAVELAPRHGAILAEAAMAAEFDGRLDEAERLLLQAAETNRLWLPRWSLANFYLRHERPDAFRHWAALAFERAYGDRRALFRLCREAGITADGLLEMAAVDPGNLPPLLEFLSADGPPEALPPAALRCLAAAPAPPRAADALLTAVNALLRHNLPGEIPPVWNGMAARGLVPYPAWTEAAPLVNAGFRPPLPGGGLDWRIPRLPGVEAFPGVPANGIKFTFSGAQPESATLLEQPLLLRGGRRWRLEFEYETPGIAPAASSLFWELEGFETAGAAARLAATAWTPATVAWQAPPGLHLARLMLRSERPRGHARHEGELRLRHLTLTPEPAP